MPVDLEDKLKKQAKKRGFSKERTDRYVYGTLRKMGWVPKQRRQRKKF